MEEKKVGITGSTLKMIAIVTMLIDHIGATIFERLLAIENAKRLASGAFIGQMGLLQFFQQDTYFAVLQTVYLLLRSVGRLGFPIFIFLLVEGFIHTRNPWKYFGRLCLFALISEIPFDLAFQVSLDAGKANVMSALHSQNVFFTLAIGLLAIIFIAKVEEKQLKKGARIGSIIGISFIGIVLGYLLRTDYAGIGVLAIIVMYLFHRNKEKGMLLTCCVLMGSSLLEIFGYLAILPIQKYNGMRGWNLKYVFYAFYPVHLLILWIICYFMGIA